MAGLTKASNSVVKNPHINPNLIVDGNFDYWFEGTSQTTSGYGSDTMSRNEHVGCTKTHTRGVFAAGETDSWFEQNENNSLPKQIISLCRITRLRKNVSKKF